MCWVCEDCEVFRKEMIGKYDLEVCLRFEERKERGKKGLLL